jgi:hypothetical protein
LPRYFLPFLSIAGELLAICCQFLNIAYPLMTPITLVTDAMVKAILANH